MITYRISRLLALKGITKPVAYLTKAGFNHNTAWRLSRDKVQNLTTDQIEKLCIALNCSPNELLEYIPGEKQNLKTSHPLNALIYTQKQIDIQNVGADIPVNKLAAFSEELQELKKKYS